MSTYFDEDENEAVRYFLMIYGGNNNITIGKMQAQMKLYGIQEVPAWVETSHSENHLTKAGAQSWLRFLFEEYDD